MQRAFREAEYTLPHNLQFRSVAQLVAWHANSLCTALARLANPFLPNLFQILSPMLKLGICFAIKGNVVQLYLVNFLKPPHIRSTQNCQMHQSNTTLFARANGRRKREVGV
jgi:hypothetical protein